MYNTRRKERRSQSTKRRDIQESKSRQCAARHLLPLRVANKQKHCNKRNTDAAEQNQVTIPATQELGWGRGRATIRYRLKSVFHMPFPVALVMREFTIPVVRTPMRAVSSCLSASRRIRPCDFLFVAVLRSRGLRLTAGMQDPVG